MDKCPNCGYEEVRCDVECCDNPAKWQGFARRSGPFNVPTGMIQLRNVCEKHKCYLIGQEPSVHEQGRGVTPYNDAERRITGT